MMTSIWKDREYMALEVIPTPQNYKSNTGVQFLPDWSSVFSTEWIESFGRTIQGRASLQMVSHWSPTERALILSVHDQGPRSSTTAHVRPACPAPNRSMKNELFPISSHVTSHFSHFCIS